MTRALIVGADAGEIDDLARAARDLLSASCSYLALELDTSTTDPELAWGTAQPVLRRLDITSPEDDDGRVDEPAVLIGAGTVRPLGADGDVAPAVLEAAHAAGANVIVTAVRPQSWLARIMSGSAALELLDASDIPVLMINRAPRR